MDNNGFQIETDSNGNHDGKNIKEFSCVNGFSTADKGKDIEADKEGFHEEGKAKIAPPIAPDGGWGWLVVLGAFMSQTVGSGIERSKGILYLELMKRFQKSSTETTWVLTLSSSIGCLGGPLVSGLCDRLSCRTAGYIGTALTSAGLLISGFVQNMTILYVTYGILTGIGKTLAYASCLIVVGLYFDKRLGLAVGLATAGNGVGSFAFPPLVELMFAGYGYRGAFMLLAALFSQSFVGASLFRPLRNVKTRRMSTPYIKSDIGSSDDQLPGKGQTSNSTDKSNITSNGPVQNEARTKECGTKPALDCKLLCHFAFTATCVQVLFHHMAKQAVLMFLPAFAVSRGLSVAESAMLLFATGICESVTKFLLTIILDIKRIKRYRLGIHSVVVLLMGVVTASLPSMTSYLQFIVASCLYGFLSGTRSQKTIVIVDTLGSEHLSGAMGWLLLFQGVGSIIGPTLTAVYKDYNGDYDMTIYLGAIGHLTGGLFIATGALWLHFNYSKDKHHTLHH